MSASIPAGPKPELIEATEVCVVYCVVNRLLCRSFYHTRTTISSVARMIYAECKQTPLFRFVSNDGNST